MKKQHKAAIMSVTYNSQQEQVISNCEPVRKASFSNDLPNTFN